MSNEFISTEQGSDVIIDENGEGWKKATGEFMVGNNYVNSKGEMKPLDQIRQKATEEQAPNKTA
jgi:hypothetical protein